MTDKHQANALQQLGPESSLEAQSDAIDAGLQDADSIVEQLSQIYAQRLRAGQGLTWRPDPMFPQAARPLLDGLRGDNSIVDRATDSWLIIHKARLDTLPKGMVVAINLLTGDFVPASTRVAAIDAFETKFGTNKTIGRLHEVGGGIVLGGGIA